MNYFKSGSYIVPFISVLYIRNRSIYFNRITAIDYTTVTEEDIEHYLRWLDSTIPSDITF